MSNSLPSGQIGMQDPAELRQFPAGCRRPSAGVSLIELLCVMVIIIILASLLLPTVSRAYRRVRGMVEEWESEEILPMIVHQCRNYAADNPQYHFDSKADFARKCGLVPKCADWVQASTTDFFSFNYLDPTNKIVLVFRFGRRHATTNTFDKQQLCSRPPER